MAKKESKSTQAATDPGKRQVVTLELPTFKTDGYVGRRIDMRLSTREAIACRRLFDGLRKDHATLADGSHIDRQPDVIRWVLNRIYYELHGDADPFSIIK